MASSAPLRNRWWRWGKSRCSLAAVVVDDAVVCEVMESSHVYIVRTSNVRCMVMEYGEIAVRTRSYAKKVSHLCMHKSCYATA